MGFLSKPFTNQKTAGEGGGHFFNSSLPLPPASQTFRHYPGNYCRELTSVHRQQPDSNREPLVSECKLLTTKLCARFIDRFQLLTSLLDGLVKNLSNDDFKYLSQEFGDNLLDLVKQKAFYPYEYMGNFEKFKEQLPSKEKFYSSLTDKRISDKEDKHVFTTNT